jgi:hypothetical protein
MINGSDDTDGVTVDACTRSNAPSIYHDTVDPDRTTTT